MSLHQIIYTSCMRGINGVNDGQQIYSYDASFKEANNDEVKSLFSYQPPALDPGERMTEEIALTLPKSFIYRKLDIGISALALNTYLGRDYMGSAGRFGNHLSHVILADEEEFRHYPCEYYGSNMLRQRMEYEEVNNPNRPDFLPEPTLERGFAVDIGSVTEFLSVGGRIDIFKDMVYALLSFEKERKRLVICDEPENIVMWIAAIEYILPLKTALGINFSTYDFDPSLSSSQICGVIPKGSRYTEESQRVHFVFDFYQNSFPQFEKDDVFFDFLDTAMTFSYDSLQDFHRFIEEGYNYDKANEKMYAAYRLYSLLSDGVEGINSDTIIAALGFADEYATQAEYLRIVQNLFEQKEYLLKSDIQAFIGIFVFIKSKYESLSDEYKVALIELVVDKVLSEFSDASDEGDFLAFYQKIDAICAGIGCSIATELIKNYREKLFAVVQKDFVTWKIAFVAGILSKFVKGQRLSVDDLLFDSPIGQTYYGLVQAVYSQNVQNGFFLVTRILDEYSSDCKYLVNMALNIEGMLLDLPNGNQAVASLWQYFGQIMQNHSQSDFSVVLSVLEQYQRYEQIYMLYSLAMSKAENTGDSRKIFTEHYERFIVRDKEYNRQYGTKILNEYYRCIGGCADSSSYEAEKDLFRIVSKSKIDIPFAENLVKDIVKPIPFETPSKENGAIIQDSFEYLYNTLHKRIGGKILLLVVGMVLERCGKINQLNETLKNLERLTADGKADLSRIHQQAAERYFEWILPNICMLCKSKSDLKSLYSLFVMPADVQTLFFSCCAKIYLKQSYEQKDYSIFCEYLGTVFEKNNPKICEEVGKILCKLNKQKLSDLDEAVNYYYQDDKAAIRIWNEIKGIAENTNPFFNSISNFFKRKKD